MQSDFDGEVISSGNDTPGEPVTAASSERTNSDQNRPYEPEIISGADTEPATEKFTAPTDGVRLNKSGKPDGRATRWANRRAATGVGAGKEAEKHVRLDRVGLVEAINTANCILASTLDMLFKFNKEQKEIWDIEDEANEKLAGDIREYGKYHNLTFDPKKVAEFNLAMTVGSIYVTRMVATVASFKNAQPATPPRPQPVPMPAPKANGAPAPDLKTSSPSSLFGSESAMI